MVTEGTQAPAVTLQDHAGKWRSLSEYKGSWALLYFYPKDDTPGCTKESCALRDDLPQFERLDCAVLGISPDSVESHAAFREKYDLPFPLLADPKKEAIRAYGVWGKKQFMGREYEGVLRTSFLIDPAGYIAKAYRDVKPASHAEEVLRDLEVFQK